MKKCVEHEGLSAIAANGGMEGLRLAEEYKTSLSLVILDVMMPDLDGFQVLQKIREVSNVPVLMLTAKSDEEDKVSGLRLGADDYLTKPFSINELMARVNSLVRRYTTLNQTTEVCTGKITLQGMTIDKNNRVVTVNGAKARCLVALDTLLIGQITCIKGQIIIHLLARPLCSLNVQLTVSDVTVLNGTSFTDP